MYPFIQVPTISVQEALLGSYTLVDVRTPAEFEEFHLPNSINIPIFLNEERVQVGTIYKQMSKEKAKEVGVQLLSEKLPTLYARIKDIYEANQRPIVVYCWRGGMRSKSVVVTMSALEIPTLQLSGGIRSYRQQVTATFEQMTPLAKPFIVLEGNTGIGKTSILQVLQQEGYPVLDLEGIANHRGSIFGGIGLAPRSQKMFDSLLFERLRELENAPYYIIEAESKRMGHILLPHFLLEGKAKGTRLHVSAPLSYRVQTICNMYQFEQYKAAFYEAFIYISKRLHTDIRQEIEEAFAQNDASSVVQLLLEHYYDPRYEHTAKQYETVVYPLFIQSLEEGIQKVKQCIENLQANRQPLL